MVKAFGREEYAFARFDERATALFDTEVRKVGVSAKFWTLLEAIPTVSLIVVLGLGAYAAGNGLVTMGTLVAFITMMLSLVWPIASLGFLLSMTQESMTAATASPRSLTRHARSPTGHGAAPAATSNSSDTTARRPAAAHRRRIRFPDSDQWALRHVNVTIEPGETLALVGSTGSGKSVLVSLLSRLYDVTEGAILLDGRDIRELSLPALRQAVATAFEDPTLFSMSVTRTSAG